MSEEERFYRKSDKTIEKLRKLAVRRFSDAKSRMGEFNFDELNVLRVTKELYRKLKKDNDDAFYDLLIDQYEEYGGKGKLSKKWLKEHILNAYDEVTLYIYNKEVERKRDRAAESINSSSSKTAEMAKALKYWYDMTRQYADTVAFDAVIEAYASEGVERVQWITAGDDRVCEECEELDGKVFAINEIPPRPHWGCRCVLIPVSDD